VIVVDGRHRHCGAILHGTKGVTSLNHVIEIQFHSDKNANATQDFRHATRLLKGVWIHFTPGLHARHMIIITIINSTVYIYRVAQKSKSLPNNQKIVLNRIKACH